MTTLPALTVTKWKRVAYCYQTFNFENVSIENTSVADPGCLSRIPDPDFYPSRIPDLGSRIQKQQQKREVKKIRCHTFLCSHKYHKIVNYLSFEVLKKKIWANFQRIIELFTKKVVKKLLKIWSWDPGSGKNLFRIPDPGVKKAPDPGSRIRIRNTGKHVEIYNGMCNTAKVLKEFE